MSKGLKQVVFDEGRFADGEAMDPKGQEEVLDTVFDQFGVFCEAGTVVEEVLVVGVHQFTEGIGVAVAEFVPKKEVLIQ
jgi:hypothetical protein